MEKLYLNKKLVDLKEGSITRKIQISDIGDIATRKSSYSYTVKLLKTANNMRILDMLATMGDKSRKPYELISVDYYINSIPIIYNGFAKVTAVSNYYEVVLYDGLKNLSETLGDKTIKDLPLTDLDHYLTSQTYVDSFNNDSGYIYAIAEFGKGVNETPIKVESQAPSVYVHTLISKIFQSNDFNLVGNFWTNNVQYKKEVITPLRGYDIQDLPATVTDKGSISTNTISHNETSTEFIRILDELQISGTNLSDCIIENNRLKFTKDMSVQLNLSFGFSIIETYVTAFVLLNDSVISATQLDGETSPKLVTSIFNVNTNDVLTLEILGQSNHKEGNYSVLYSADASAEIKERTGGQLIKPADYLGEIKQIDLLKDVIKRYGLVLHPIKNSKDYKFEQLDNILNNTSNSVDWTNKLNAVKKITFKPNYAQNNKATFQYLEDVETKEYDGVMTVDNQNLQLDKTMISSSFQIPNRVQSFLLNDLYSVPIWEVEEQEVKLKETPLKLMSVKKVDGYLTVKLFDEATVITVNNNIPILSLDNISMQGFLNDNYSNFKKLITDYKEIDCIMNLSSIDIFNLDFFKLVFLRQTGRYYYLNSVTYSANKQSKVKMLEIVNL